MKKLILLSTVALTITLSGCASTLSFYPDVTILSDRYLASRTYLQLTREEYGELTKRRGANNRLNQLKAACVFGHSPIFKIDCEEVEARKLPHPLL